MIKGDAGVIAASKNSQPGDPSNMVNWDALNELPELYDGQIVQVTFQPPVDDKNPGDFAPVGNDTYMPSPDLMNKIAAARGISGLEMGTSRAIVQDIDWNRMTCNFTDPPRLIKYLVGYEVVKQGEVLSEDGTMRHSDPCVVIYNAWERVCELWGREEQYTDMYTHPAKYPNKYDTRAKRQACFDAELKFAERKADTKARQGVIRSLCGLQTGYRKEDLKKGYFVFGKIVRSAWAIKSEHAARLQALARGVGDHTASAALFGPTEPEPVKNVTPQPEPEQLEEHPEETVSSPDLATQALQPEPAPKQLTAVFVKSALESYAKGGLVPDALKQPCENLVAWLDRTTDAEKTAYWDKTVKTLDAVEQAIPEEMRIKR